jgi:hypothetical protein
VIQMVFIPKFKIKTGVVNDCGDEQLYSVMK